jgi:hypothetical protein
MDKYIVSYDIALKLKELGFNEPCLFAYSEQKKLINYEFSFKDDVIAPLYDQVLEWFRIKGFHFNATPITHTKEWYYGVYDLNTRFLIYNGYKDNQIPKSYEEARDKGIEWILNHLKENDGSTRNT